MCWRYVTTAAWYLDFRWSSAINACRKSCQETLLLDLDLQYGRAINVTVSEIIDVCVVHTKIKCSSESPYITDFDHSCWPWTIQITFDFDKRIIIWLFALFSVLLSLTFFLSQEKSRGILDISVLKSQFIMQFKSCITYLLSFSTLQSK